jgi:hypothetical protein
MKSYTSLEAKRKKKHNQQAYMFSPRSKKKEKGTDVEKIQQIFPQI